MAGWSFRRWRRSRWPRLLAPRVPAEATAAAAAPSELAAAAPRRPARPPRRGRSGRSERSRLDLAVAVVADGGRVSAITPPSSAMAMCADRVHEFCLSVAAMVGLSARRRRRSRWPRLLAPRVPAKATAAAAVPSELAAAAPRRSARSPRRGRSGRRERSRLDLAVAAVADRGRVSAITSSSSVMAMCAD